MLPHLPPGGSRPPRTTQASEAPRASWGVIAQPGEHAHFGWWFYNASGRAGSPPPASCLLLRWGGRRTLTRGVVPRPNFMPAHGRAPLPLLLGLFLAYTLTMPRPTVMTQPVRDEICQKLAEGNSLRSICLDESMPAISTVLLAVVQNRDGFSEQYMQARTAGGFSHADRIIDTVDRVATGEFDPQAARAMLDGLKWAAERMAPKNHSSRQEVDHQSSDGTMTPRTITATDPVEASKQYQDIMGGDE